MTFNAGALRRARELRGWSQAQVAREVGTDARSVGRWERGFTRPSPHFRQQLCQLFQLDAEALGLLEQISLFVASSASPPEPLLDPARPHPSLLASQVIERPDILESILTRLETGTLCVLYGLPGVGKTTLLSQLSLHPRCQEHFVDGFLWIRLGPTPQVEHELRRIATLLQVPETASLEAHDISTLSSLVHQALSTRRLLLIIDDAWHVQDVQPFLIGGAQTAHVITTRLPEVAFALPGATPLLVTELTIAQSQQLLQTLVPQLSECFTSQEWGNRLYQITGGLPLALRLVGSLLRRQLVGGQARRIQSTLTSLVKGFSAMPSLFTTPIEGALSLETLLALSEQPLSSSARETLHALSVLPAKPASFSEAAALAVCEQRVEMLDALLDAGLLEGVGEGQYQIHQVIADYARLHLSDEAPWQRLVAYALQVSQQVDEAMPVILQEWAVFEAAWNVAHQRMWSHDLLSLTVQLDEVWYTQGFHRLAMHRLHIARVLAEEQQDYQNLCNILAALASHAKTQGDLPQAQSSTEALLHLAQTHHFAYEQARALNSLGVLAAMRGDLSNAETYYQEVLTLAEHLTHPRPRLAALTNRGSIHFEQGQFQEAESYWQQGLIVSQQVHALDWRCGFLQSLASLYLSWAHQGERVDAYLAEAHMLAEQLHDVFEQTAVAVRQAQLACRKRASADVELFLRRAQQLAERSDHVNLQYQVQVESALLLIAIGHTAQAEEHLLRLVPYAPLSGIHVPLRAREELAWGELRLAQHRSEEAEQHFHAAEQLLCPAYRLHHLHCRYGLARVLALQGCRAEARELGQACLTHMQQCDYWQTADVQTWLKGLPLSFSAPVSPTQRLSPVEACFVTVSQVEVQTGELSQVEKIAEFWCPYCQSQHIIRRGKDRRGTQRYLCRTCERTFNSSTKRGVSAYSSQMQEQARRLVEQGKSLRTVARTLQVHHETVRRWLRMTEDN